MTEPAPLINAKEAGLLLRRSRSWIYAHLDDLPHLRLPGGGSPLFDRDELLKWARARLKHPSEVV